MKIIAFDTSSQDTSVALLNEDKMKLLHQKMPMQHAKFILSMIDELLHSQNLSLEDLDAIAYGCGPGSFTGIRIASSVAQGIGFASQLPIIPISSLEVLAYAAYIQYKVTQISVAIDARMGQVYFAKYYLNKEGIMEVSGDEKLKNLDDIINLNNEPGWTVISDILKDKTDGQTQLLSPSNLPIAEALLSAAKIKLQKRQWVTAYFATPVYLR